MNGFSSFKEGRGATVSDGVGIVCNSDMFDYQADYHLPMSKQINE